MNNSLYLNTGHSLVPFKIKMISQFVFAAILFFSTLGFAQTTLDINCSDNQCNSTQLANAYSSCASIINKSQCEARVLNNLCEWIDAANPNGGNCTSLPQQKICTGYNCPIGSTMSIIKPRGVSDLDLSVLTNSTGRPQNIGIAINNGAFPGKNANIAINGKNQTSNGANTIVIADNFNNLNVNLDGYNGARGKHASEICADKIKNGDYGVPLQTYFNNRRATTSADPSRCDSDDLNYMQTFNFSCDDPAYQEVSSTNPIVQVNQVKKLARCNAVASYSYCVKKKVNISCNFKLWSAFRQKWVEGSDLANPSYHPGPQTCAQVSGSCGMVTAQCSNSGTVQQIYGPNNMPSAEYNRCIYRAGGTPICQGMTGSSFYTEGFFQETACTETKTPGMPLTRQSAVQQFDEDFFNTEVARLGGVDQFCNAYGQIPPKSNQDWWSGIPGAPGSAYNGAVESTGIPWEFMSQSTAINNYNAPAEPYGAILNWKAETQAQGGYTPLTVRDAVTTYTNTNQNITVTTVYTWKTKGSYWKSSGSTYSFSSPGLNPDGLTLTPGSLWQVSQTNTFENCPTGWTTLKNVFVNLVQYTNKENVSCSGITDPLDPNNRAFWQYTGITQEPTFGTEFVSCGIGSCAVNSTVSELGRSLDTISPGSGESGTEQGRGLFFVYDIKNLSARALAGGAGTVGNTDININPQTRICAKIDDANAGINTDQAKNPFVSFRRYQWQAVKSVSGGNPGTPPANNGKSVEVFKKIDPAARYLLDKSLL